jgi:ParB-like chromosome segregation protein Spo0J
MNTKIVQVRIADIKIGNRFRKDMGEIDGLAASIDETGLLQPIGITPDHQLVFGLRRLLAYRNILGKETILARIVPMESLFLGEILENTMRKEYTLTERVAIADALRSFRHGGDRRSDQARTCDVETLTVDQAAKRAGLGGKDTYLRAKDVTTHGVPELVQAMESHKLSIAAASEIAKLSPDDQLESVRRGKRAIARDPHDFYPTPRYVTEALLQVETFGRQVWEPACGDGAMAEVLKAAGYEVLASDLIDRGHGDIEDFLTSNQKAESIVTNPPFDKDDEFVRKALVSTNHKVAMLLSLTFLEGSQRAKWLQITPLKTVHIFASRVNLCKNGEQDRKNGRFVFAWFVWEHGYFGPPTISWIDGAKPETPPALAKSSARRENAVMAVETVRLPAP